MIKTLLVLAASTYQMAAIETAKRMGYRVITTDNVPTNPGHALADKSYNISTTDSDTVLDLAIEEGISGILAPGTDVAVVTAAYVAERLGLTGPPVHAAHVLTHKHEFRRFLAGTGLPCPNYFLLEPHTPTPAGIFHGDRWLLKPCRASGSKGVFIVRDEQTLQAHLADSRSHSLDGAVLLEEYIEGTQHTCEGILDNGQVVLALITDRDTVPPPHTATCGHRVPSLLPSDLQAQAVSNIETVFSLLGVHSGPFDCDFVVSGDRVVIIEMTPRLGGNSLSRLFKAALGFDLVAYAVAHACGDPTPAPTMCLPMASAVVILGSARAGRLAWDEKEFQALCQEDWVISLSLDHPQGTFVKPFTNGRHRVGEALIRGADRADVDARLSELQRRLALTAN